MKRPSTIQGQAAPAAVVSGSAITKTGEYLFEVWGTGAKPYIVDLNGHDIRLKPGETTETCTCINWKMERNKLVGAGQLPHYKCKHLKKILADIVDDEYVSPEVRKRAEEIVARFKKAGK